MDETPLENKELKLDATAAAQTHADNLGVDLAEVSGTGGVDGTTVTKADVTEHAAQTAPVSVDEARPSAEAVVSDGQQGADLHEGDLGYYLAEVQGTDVTEHPADVTPEDAFRNTNVTYPAHPLGEFAPDRVDATENAPESPADDFPVLNDCGHSGPGFTAASGTGTVTHCGKCAGMGNI